MPSDILSTQPHIASCIASIFPSVPVFADSLSSSPRARPQSSHHTLPIKAFVFVICRSWFEGGSGDGTDVRVKERSGSTAAVGVDREVDGEGERGRKERPRPSSIDAVRSGGGNRATVTTTEKNYGGGGGETTAVEVELRVRPLPPVADEHSSSSDRRRKERRHRPDAAGHGERKTGGARTTTAKTSNCSDAGDASMPTSRYPRTPPRSNDDGVGGGGGGGEIPPDHDAGIGSDRCDDHDTPVDIDGSETCDGDGTEEEGERRHDSPVQKRSQRYLYSAVDEIVSFVEARGSCLFDSRCGISL